MEIEDQSLYIYRPHYPAVDLLGDGHSMFSLVERQPKD